MERRRHLEPEPAALDATARGAAAAGQWRWALEMLSALWRQGGRPKDRKEKRNEMKTVRLLRLYKRDFMLSNVK